MAGSHVRGRSLLFFLVVVPLGFGTVCCNVERKEKEVTRNPAKENRVTIKDRNTYQGVLCDILDKLDAESKARLRRCARDDLIAYLHGWGTAIRNEYGLWTNEPLRRSCAKKARVDGDMDAEAASLVIIEGVWEAANDGGPE